MPKFLTKITAITQASPTVKIITFDTPLDFVPGQFVMLTVPGYLDKTGKGPKRAYSIASAPGEPLELVIKINPAPSLSSTIDALKIGDSAEVDGPFGKFVLREPVKQDTMFIAGGTGIAPLMSMIRHVTKQSAPPHMKLLFGIKTIKDCIYREELAKWEKKGILIVITCLSQEEVKGLHHGRVTSILPHHTPLTDVYICGSPQMAADTITVLRTLGVSLDRIFKEQW
ncbi:FAD-dependent oxidoreductase [Candidatus Woesearchaeota archaeon]|nr:FAD-dependent oxidoreductase [Candidatus Woesearchaeota archaeon]